jgi:hypothetical protein
MSFCKSYYVIAGYDLTAYKTETFRDWKWSEEGKKHLCYQYNGKIQLFEVDGDLYLGYIIGHGDQYEFNPVMFNMDLVKLVETDVFHTLRYLVNIGIIEEKALEKAPYKIIIFEECY